VSLAPALLAQFATNPESGVPLAPRWGWYVVLYFFIGGVTAGCYAVACMLDLVGDPRDRRAVSIGYRLAFPGVLICAVLLVLDLGRPERFWHMLIQSHRPPLPAFKWWSPISLGSWILSAFGLFAFVSFIDELIRGRWLTWPLAVRLAERLHRLPRAIRATWKGLGILSALGLAGYTGVLMMSSTAPTWHNAYLLGALFLASAFSSAYALMILLLVRYGGSHADPTVRKLHDADRSTLVIELVLLAVLIVGLGRLARPFLTGGYGALFWLGTVLVGLIVPLALEAGRWMARDAERRTLVRAACILVGGLVLRYVIVMAPQYPQVPPWHL
jgi:formate-dependent nitrite reductase membrane component NrfD